ncbi:MAG TPA: thioredoxin domain-containing protein [Pyrinomonadaceae bacterium]|nr:thioredoxin domain-containing protein [Pyrinomonadaceae bacterium]
MKTATLVLISIIFLSSAIGGAQTRGRRGSRTPAVPKSLPSPPVTEPTPASIPTGPPPAPLQPVLLAVVNGQNVTTAEIDPKVREEVESLPLKIAEARRQVLELEINTLLLESEARKRKLTSQQFYDTEVTKKLTPPTAAEIDKFIRDNREQIDQSDPARVREDVAAFLLGEKEAKISGDLVNRLRSSNPVVKGADFTGDNLAPSIVLATVGGRTITAGKVNERLKSIIYRLRLNTWEIQKPALDTTINDLLLLAEADKRNVPPEEIVRKEISERIKSPTDAEVEKFYTDNKARIKEDLNSIRTQIANYLQEQDRARLEREFSERLRKGADVRLITSEPEPPVQTISVDNDPSRGDANAPVTIVEFTDFQCPSCAAMHPILEDVLKTYGSKVRLVIRDFPLNMHAHARKAAEAANAAHAQGKFFEYAALLFKRQNALDVPSLKKYATEVGLNRAQFDSELDSGKYAPEVRHDISEGEVYGIDSTPTIFVNGVALRVFSAAGLKQAVDRALAGPNASRGSTP